ncbi:phospholipase D-like domain-containing protein [Desulfovermiculus halophilus]|uniref:phospholipase D-like domain-containing protein n=1 Tax=Desulfovermiculus halophilus TaxID=339722 RepID=UPI00048040C6|nr:phospholipase D-like domain-containing protein [Desulfovermiculus halophilus]
MQFIQWWFITLLGIFQLYAAGHALLYKRDPKASWAWIATCILLPPFGAILYFLLGINRVRTKAKSLKWYWPLVHIEFPPPQENTCLAPIQAMPNLEGVSPTFRRIADISEAVTKRPLLCQNRVAPLFNGEQAFPAMLQAIDAAEHSVYLQTYIFETNDTGQRFIQALQRAQARGVDVRVIVDGIGELYFWPRASKLLSRKKVPCARFMPLRLFPPSAFINLRNHRKILTVDGKTGFTGGMNIGDRHLFDKLSKASRVKDVHFQCSGPIVAQMEQVFLEDWGFCTGDEELNPSELKLESSGPAVCRSITVGPNQDLNKLSMILVGAISQAQDEVMIMTPYFLPNRELVGALQAAALRGVRVNIVLPGKNNLPYVHWATRNMLWELLQYGVRVFYQPPPFNHSKLFLVDDCYGQIGSANLDPRSLRLNFEMVVEFHDQELIASLTRHVLDTIQISREETLEQVDGRSLPARVRDSFFWLFSPYF